MPIIFLIILVLFSMFFCHHPYRLLGVQPRVWGWSHTVPWKNRPGDIVYRLFFLCVLLHEIVHSYIGLRMRQQALSITLFIFGDISQLDDILHNPSLELKIALAGPRISIALGALFFFFLFFVTNTINAILSFNLFSIALESLSFYNLLIGFFNFIPAFPLDGNGFLGLYGQPDWIMAMPRKQLLQ